VCTGCDWCQYCTVYDYRIKSKPPVKRAVCSCPIRALLPICASRRCFHFVQATIVATFAAPQGAFVLLATLKRVFVFFYTQLVQCDIVFVLFFYILFDCCFIESYCTHIISFRPKVYCRICISNLHVCQISSTHFCLSNIP